MGQLITTIIASAVPTLAVIAAFVRNEASTANLNARMDTLSQDMNSRFETLTRDMDSRFERVDLRFETLTRDMNSRFETLTRRVDAVDTDLREWARISMQHNTDIARLKDKTGLSDLK
jgi:hypothetical protein